MKNILLESIVLLKSKLINGSFLYCFVYFFCKYYDPRIVEVDDFTVSTLLMFLFALFHILSEIKVRTTFFDWSFLIVFMILVIKLKLLPIVFNMSPMGMPSLSSWIVLVSFVLVIVLAKVNRNFIQKKQTKRKKTWRRKQTQHLKD